MAYSAAMKQAIGATRTVLNAHGMGLQDTRFLHHGDHAIDKDAPLLLVACSGGRDSLALAAVAQITANAWGMRCGAVIIDHDMQEGSAHVAQETADTCYKLGLQPVLVKKVNVVVDTQGAEAAARYARYQALTQLAHTTQASAVLLAHTRDDQAETVLIDLIRSAGTDAVAGMTEAQHVDGVLFLRPLLDITRAQTTAICNDLHLQWWDDPTNGDAFPSDKPLPPTYPLRSRIRHTLLPMLSEFAGRDMVSRLAESARIARRDIEYLDDCTAQLMQSCVRLTESSNGGLEATIDASLLAQEPQALRYRVIAQVLARCVSGYNASHVDAIESLVSQWHGQQPVRLPRKYSAKRQKHVIRVCEDVTHANRRRARQD